MPLRLHVPFEQGDREPESLLLEHEREVELLPEVRLDDGSLASD